MKRTKERLDFAHPKGREGISGCTFFDGEDKIKPARTKEYIEETKFWVDKQKEEKKLKEEMDLKEKKLYGKQDIHNCVLLGISQDHLKNNKRTMAKACYDANVELHKEKKCKDAHAKFNEQKQDKDDLQSFTLSKEVKWKES